MLKLLLATLILLVQTTSSLCQNRYLERFENDGKSAVKVRYLRGVDQVNFIATYDSASNRFSIVRIDGSFGVSKTSLNASSIVLNLTTGRVEMNLLGTEYYFFAGKTLRNSNSNTNGRVSHKSAFSEISRQYFLYDDTDSTRVDMKGHNILDIRSNKIYTVTKSDGWKYGVFEMSHGSMAMIAEIPKAALLQLSDNGKFAVAQIRNKLEKFGLPEKNSIFSYSVPNSEVVTYCFPLDNGEILYATGSAVGEGDIKHLTKEGSIKRIFKSAGSFFSVNDMGTELLSCTNDGKVILWDLKTGEKLEEERDVFVKNATFLNRKIVKSPQKIGKGELYLIPYSDGIVSLYSSKERKVVAKLFFDDNDWVILSKSGNFEGTAGALEKLAWCSYDEAGALTSRVEVGSTFDRYYHPRLFYSILSGEKSILDQVNGDLSAAPRPILSLQAVDNNPVSAKSSQIQFSSRKKNISVDILVRENKNEVKELRLYHNGKLIAVSPASADGVYKFQVSLNSVNGQQNYFYAIATSKGGVDSDKCKFIVDYAGAVSQDPRLFAIVIGINQYKNPKYRLNYAVADGNEFKAVLQKHSKLMFGEVEIVTLFDSESSKESILMAFDKVSSMANENDLFVFYYAGHGTVDEISNEFFIVPFDVTQLYGNSELLQDKAISAAEIKRLSMSINAQKQVFFIDACHSGGSLIAASARGAAEEKAMGQLARSTGTFWLTASSVEQFATEFQELGHGVFTYSLLEALQGKGRPEGQQPVVTVREISSYVEQRVPELSEKYKGAAQYPSSFSFGNDFPIAIGIK